VFCIKRHRFLLKKKNRLVLFWATLFPFLLPVDMQQGKVGSFTSSSFFIKSCVPRALQKPKGPRTLMMRNQGRRALPAASTNQPGAALPPRHSNKEPLLPWPYKWDSAPAHSGWREKEGTERRERNEQKGKGPKKERKRGKL